MNEKSHKNAHVGGMGKRILVLFVILTQLYGSVGVFASPIPNGVTGQGLYGNYVVQHNTNWCWAASAENAIRWECSDISRDQYDAVMYIKGSWVNETGTIFETSRAAKYISEDRHWYIAELNYEPYQFLCEQINDNHPVIVASGLYIDGYRKNGHAVLVCAWYNGNGYDNLTYYDSALFRYRTCTYEEFRNGDFNGKIYDETCFHM